MLIRANLLSLTFIAIPYGNVILKIRALIMAADGYLFTNYFGFTHSIIQKNLTLNFDKLKVRFF